MKASLSDKMERGRIRSGPYASDRRAGMSGAFIVTAPGGALLHIMSADGNHDEVQGWEHVSVSLKHRCPNWQEMCWVKEQFFEDDEWVVQYHTAKTDHINTHSFCLHLWRHNALPFPRPPKHLV